MATLIVALFIGAAAGAVSVIRTPAVEAEQTSLRYLSGFREFKGVPSTSVSASYLQLLDREVRP